MKAFALPFLLVWLSLASPGGASKGYSWLVIKHCHPTQFSVGMGEVEARAKKLRKLSDDEAREYLKQHAVRTVLGPGGTVYLIDGHHLALAAWVAGYPRVREDRQADWSDLSEAEFWRKMIAAQWAYLYDEDGAGPFSPRALPDDLRDLRDDPYRTLAWEARKAGGYEKTSAPFAEFRWAGFFRDRVTPWHGENGFERALRRALKLAGSALAAGLPGYLGARQERARACREGFARVALN